MKSLYNSVKGQTRRRPRRRIGEQPHEQKKAILSLSKWDKITLADRLRDRLGNPPKICDMNDKLKAIEILSANPILSDVNFKNDLERWTKIRDFVEDNHAELPKHEQAKLIGNLMSTHV